MHTPADYMAMLPYATDRQGEAVRHLVEQGSFRKAAKAMGITERPYAALMQRLRILAARKGVSPLEDRGGLAPEGYYLRGKSTLYREDGSIAAQWVKTGADITEQQDLLRESAQEFAEQFRDAQTPAPKRSGCNPDLMAVVPIGDPHFGLYAWGEEAGENFDLKIARDLMHKAVGRLVQNTPSCGLGLLINLGDFFHSDTQANRTLRSGNPLDVDTRWGEVLRVGVAALKSAIDMMLRKHAQVKVINVIGNHDDHSAVFLSLVMAEAYAKEKRVQIVVDPGAFHYHRFGQVLIGTTHGHTVKAEQLPGLMAHDVPKEWGATKHRHWYVGHYHHHRAMDFPGCTVEYCRSLVAKDAWTAAAGYRAYRDMRCIVYHRQYGEVESHRVGVESL